MDSSRSPDTFGRPLTAKSQFDMSELPALPLATLRPLSEQFRSNPGSRAVSRASSIKTVDASAQDPTFVAKYLSRRATLLGFFDETEDQSGSNAMPQTGLAIKTPESDFIFQPSDVSPLFALAAARIDSKAVLSMASDVIPNIVDSLQPDQKSIYIESTGLMVPILPSFEAVNAELAATAKACILVKERVMLVWSNTPKTIVNAAHDVETQLLGMSHTPGNGTPMNRLSRRSSLVRFSKTPAEGSVARGAIDENDRIYKEAIALEEGVDDDAVDLEGNAPKRPELLIHAFRTGLTIMLVIITQCLSIAKLFNEYMWDGGALRFALIATVPFLGAFSLFFFSSIINGLFQIFLPASQCNKNSKFHSAVKPNPKRHKDYELPHITVQMPVYKEGLKGVIVPTMVSVMAAIQYYEERGGTASVFINDDGMQCIQPELADARKQYYRQNGIGYTARLPQRQSPKKSGFLSWFKKSSASQEEEQEKGVRTPQDIANEIGFERKGKFKKASNMNYALAFSNRVEDEMARLSVEECQRRGCTDADLSATDDDELYERALLNMLAEDEGRTWAEGNIRIGELILLIDCDTRVPIDCLLYGALEMHESPEVAILQHASGVMQVVHNTFENGITYFTNVIYTAITYGTGNGDVAPFVGHNAFIRWQAVQSVIFEDSDGKMKWWSESHVSEDFDLSLRVQTAGMSCRYATYHNGGFMEGVSLTLYDELNRWEKYAYGSNELMFNPFYQWIYKGPFSRMFLRFCWSSMPVTSKLSVISYLTIYYAIACGMFLTVVNYFIIGLFSSVLDQYYMPSFGVWLSLVVVFNGFGSVTFSILRHKLKEAPFWIALKDAIKWLPFLFIFFGGISLNCAKALLCHALSIDIEWSSTSKEVGPTGLYIGFNKMVKTFKWTWAICLVIAAAMVYMAVGAPWGWTIRPGADSTAVIAIVPLSLQIGCSFLLPFFLGF